MELNPQILRESNKIDLEIATNAQFTIPSSAKQRAVQLKSIPD
jgi:hypothetical protein